MPPDKFFFSCKAGYLPKCGIDAYPVDLEAAVSKPVDLEAAVSNTV